MTKLCECGCGQPAPLAKANHRAKGHVKGQPVRFVVGHNWRGKPKSPETRARMAAYAASRPAEHHAKLLEARRSRPPKPLTGAASIHDRLRRTHPKAGRCEECGAAGPTDYSFQRHPAPYTEVRSDYRELCRRCHMQLDIDHGVRPDWREWCWRGGGGNHGKPPKTHCIRGHAFDEANTYTSKQGSRYCRACHNEKARRYRKAQREAGSLTPKEEA